MTNFCSGTLYKEISKILQDHFINSDIDNYYQKMIDSFDVSNYEGLGNLELKDLKGISEFLLAKKNLSNLGIDLPIYFGDYTQNKTKIMIVAMDAKRSGQKEKEIVLGSVFNLHTKAGRETKANDYWNFIEPLLKDNFVYLTDIYKIYYETIIIKKGKETQIISNKDKTYTSGEPYSHNKTIIKAEINLIKPNLIIAIGKDAADSLKTIQGISSEEVQLVKEGVEYIFMPHISKTVTQNIPTVANLFIALGKIKKNNELEKIGQSILEKKVNLYSKNKKKISNMKKGLVVLFAMAMMVFTSVKAQAPQLMSFQSVIRDNTGKLVANHNVGLRLSIVQGTLNGSAVYTETQTATSNANGLVTLQIGGGSVVSGTFSAIDWTAGPYYIKSEIDPKGGTSYGIAGTTQLLSVAYALYAGKSQSSIVSINGLKGHYGFDHSTTWTCPKGITSVEVELWGASGGGGGCINYNNAGSGAGGNGGNGGYSKSTISVIPDSTYNIKIGKGGAGGNSSILNGTDGGNTSFGNLLSAQEGKGGLGFYYRSGVIQSGANGQSGQILNYNVTPLTSRTYIPSGYTILYPSSTGEGGTGAYWYSGGTYGNNGGSTNGEDGFCVISY